ncbi:restriction endonuclease subunit M [Methyloprofundus sedimenti]|uniref:site-specific DNA-methyltransferase (adenine-specific) n=1 Tax=Methyloprofundus sedimenti TaxID=1420851 RepID=A0A1V8M3C4_9GAMM|nr:class I SAM-dependent DNA methyltransferase [Methyloprofundus sedimenti]OQK16059.1 restriction endonuclease subunit M [Methyloprofundus sedimenti]
MDQTEQQFLTELEKKLWTSANKLLPSLDASQYKHVALGLVFLKYVSDSFELRRKELTAQFNDPEHEYFLDPEEFDGGATGEDYQAEINTELEQRDYYTEANVFWVPMQSRWGFLQNQNKVVINGVIWLNKQGEALTQAPNDEAEKRLCNRISSVGQLIDNALEVIEQDNPKLKGVLNKRYTQLQIDQAKLGELIDLIATIPFVHATLSSKDILGHVYEYFLGQFALAEGKKGGQFYTPKSIVSLIVQMLEPFKGRVYDPAMGSGGFFVQSENFIREHQGRIGDVSIYGQEYNHTTWQLAAMNMVIRGIDFNFGKQPASSYTNDQHPDLRADFVMANPPFNMKEWDTGVDDNDPRWVYGKPPSGNANFAWLQHMLWHLAPNGSLGLLLANGSMSSNTSGEGDIRKALIDNDLVECMVALPGQLFTNTQIPACIWFLTKNKKARTAASGRQLRDRCGDILFIDARKLGYMKDRVLRDFTPDDLNKVTETFHNWQTDETVGWVSDSVTQQSELDADTDVGLRDKAANPTYQNIPGFCKSATLAEIEKHDYVLTPGRYVGVVDEIDDGEPFADKMVRLTAQLKDQFEQSDRLEAEIKRNLGGLGYDV